MREHGRARYAADPERSRGRKHPEPPPRGRTEYQRDRDRIIHSTAFRRLEYKTQVFVNHEGDLFRTRLTHSLEVAQIGRSVARSLRLDEDLTEAIALAHDLGHTPFGHSGQDALNACMKPYGGFEHNLQSLRVVDLLEQRYGGFDGLNLTFETREGILKHCSVRNARELGDVGERFLSKRRPSLEAQIANIADEIAYNNHDVDDGLRSGLIEIDQLSEISIFRRHREAALKAFPNLAGRRLIHETVRRMIDTLVTDLIESSAAQIRKAAPRDIDAARAAPELIGFSRSDPGRTARAETVPEPQPLPALPGGAHEQQGAAHRERPLRRLHRRARPAAAGISGAGGGGQAPCHRGLHCGNDRPLRHTRAPPIVRRGSAVGRHSLSLVWTPVLH